MEINLEKFITSLLNTKANVPEVNVVKKMIENALEEQGFKYYNGSILERDDEPKFKVGDWVVYDHRVYQVVELPKEGYINLGLRGNGKIEFAPSTYCRHWTIQDAKDGDVISDGSLIVIFKKLKHPSARHNLIAYAGIDSGGKLQVTDNYWTFSDSCRLATKEERNALIDKIWAAGYTWDSDNMKLRYIGVNTVRPEVDAWVETLKTSPIPQSKEGWSNEDARNFDYEKGFRAGFSAAKFKQWKPSEQEISAIEWQLKNTSEGSWQYQKTKEVLENLKKLVGELKKAL